VSVDGRTELLRLIKYLNVPLMIEWE
jgi:hypothetical protein